MATPSLSDDLIAAGKRLLDALDGAGLEAEGAGWIYDYALAEWRYVIATSLVETLGRSTVYRMLLQIISKLDVPDALTIDDIHLLATESAVYKELGRHFMIKGESVIRFEACIVGEKKFDAILYRWGSKPPTREQMKESERKFTKRVKELLRT